MPSARAACGTVSRMIPVSFMPHYRRPSRRDSTWSERFDGPIEISPVHDPGHEVAGAGRLRQALELLGRERTVDDAHVANPQSQPGRRSLQSLDVEVLGVRSRAVQPLERSAEIGTAPKVTEIALGASRELDAGLRHRSRATGL